MDLDKVTYLLALADTRNSSRAAEQCNISQPALTRYIKNLEEELNVTLFDRSSFPIRLTYALSLIHIYGTAETGHCVYHDLTMIIKGCFQII